MFPKGSFWECLGHPLDGWVVSRGVPWGRPGISGEVLQLWMDVLNESVVKPPMGVNRGIGCRSSRKGVDAPFMSADGVFCSSLWEQDVYWGAA